MPTRHGGPWRSNSVRQILVNPRYAGRVVYRHSGTRYHGSDLPPVPAAFPAIVDEGLWDMVNERLADPRRKTAFGTDRKHLGSGLYLCGVCGKPVRSHGTPTRYRCPDGHVTRMARPVDEHVTAEIKKRLRKPDLAGLAAVPSGPEAGALTAQIKALRARLKQTERDYDADLISGKRFKEKSGKLQAELDQAEARRMRLLAGSEVAGVLRAPDAVAAFDRAPLGARQNVIRFFAVVELLHVPRGAKGFSPDTVRITRKRKARDT